jgi:hypothetical protein
MINSSTKETALYAVMIVVKGTSYLYPCEAPNHEAALRKAIEVHCRQNRPLPVGSRCWVEGPCAEADCKCGKTRTREYITMAQPALC